MSLTKKEASYKRKWLKALRSGKYKQGDSVLYNPEQKSFCCLGVLEHCLLDGNVENVWNACDLDYLSPSEERKRKKEFATFPSPKFYSSFDLGWVKDNEARLAGFNDGGDASTDYEPHDFNRIADYIEKNWV